MELPVSTDLFDLKSVTGEDNKDLSFLNVDRIQVKVSHKSQILGF